ncbi:MAG: Jag N-terminal domain-containing protein [Acidobacteria bacterium]|nr:Jag N-terminal domain-containing protein [Acidobacteriota bacterium]MCG2814998.1 Jag N-terminal domain-containing protein [Candidatus Aminicenantes bacterium]MBU1339988.1 Jag N-terminal domain-containing protein [Acidobacteriota bacterium]MBU1475203.1 Jag N-terminal domain-containing protein [Acidobacteriota bacterium]MBU2437641.1 Jag N-terminal domain-containing protein [Acidobacteriota bacterium]
MENEEKKLEKQEFKGRNLEDAIGLAEHILKRSRSQLNYEIVAEKTKLFGIKTKEIVIAAWPKEPPRPTSLEIKFLDEFISRFPLDLKYHVKSKNDMLCFIFDGPDKNLLLRKEGALLLALQHILNKISDKKVQTDCDFYRKRKERELKDYVSKIARHVHETGKNEVLDYMNPYERRIVHIAVNQVPGISTESIDEGFLKRIKIFPVKQSPN